MCKVVPVTQSNQDSGPTQLVSSYFEFAGTSSQMRRAKRADVVHNCAVFGSYSD